MNTQNIYRDNNDGRYFVENPEKLRIYVTPINTSISDNPSDWTYTDDDNRIYSPHRNVSTGSINKGYDLTALDRLYQWSNKDYYDPIVGAAARWADSWHNEQNPIRAGISYFDPTGLGEYAINKGVDLYLKGTDALNIGDAAQVGLAAAPILGKPGRYLLRGNTKRSGEELTRNVMEWFGLDPYSRFGNGTPVSRKGMNESAKQLADIFEQRGVDTSVFDPLEFNDMIEMRRGEIQSQLPRGQRYSYIETGPDGLYTIEDKINKGDKVGHSTLVLRDDGNLDVDYVEKFLDDHHGVSQRAYDAGIRLAKSIGGQGIVSGEDLIMPEITTKVWEHYPNRKLLNNNGRWGKEGVVTEGNPVYLLDEPSHRRIVKSDVFDPIIIDRDGKMNIRFDKSNLLWKNGGTILNNNPYK